MYRSPATIDEVSPQWEAALDQNLPLNEPIHQLIFSPEFSSVESHHPASALCLTDRRWLIGLAESEGVTVESATFDETLLVELTIILLHGKVKIDFTKSGGRRSAALYFNPVKKSVYLTAVCEMLTAIDRGGSKETGQKTKFKFAERPYDFEDRVLIDTPPGSCWLGGINSDIYLRAVLWRKSNEFDAVERARNHRSAASLAQFDPFQDWRLSRRDIP